MGCVLDRMYIYVSIKKQYLEMRYNNVKTFLKGFVCLFVLGPNVFFVQVVLWKVSKSYFISLLIYEYVCHWSLTSNMMFTTSLASLGHSSTPLWASGVSSLLGLALLSSNAEMLNFFLSNGWLYTLCPMTPTILNAFNIDPLVLMTRPYLLS